MKILNKEITVANRFIYYYYANVVGRIYGFVLRKEGKNLPEEHYVGRWEEEAVLRGAQSKAVVRGKSIRKGVHRQGDPQHPRIVSNGRWSIDLEAGEVIIFHYRKRLMIGTLRETRWRS